MLAHLKHLDLPPLLEHLNVRHIFLLDLLDGDLLSSLDLGCHPHQTKLAFA